ncbi:hypothetical protein MmiAt1_06330 [Methanimicrococcus sp. At1]|uniref:Uncharacterized protein n=1 Tax=Methanimicrococcus hacksteinii TaxID=3028293 RepID=A0ABU3VNU1_9EURY|nr:hypothetical protein [Methanimicrococcus sp. At1]MDV0445077.1 hypothetical protein [Methanimicrococcus sp. At1]
MNAESFYDIFTPTGRKIVLSPEEREELDKLWELADKQLEEEGIIRRKHETKTSSDVLNQEQSMKNETIQ